MSFVNLYRSVVRSRSPSANKRANNPITYIAWSSGRSSDDKKTYYTYIQDVSVGY